MESRDYLKTLKEPFKEFCKMDGNFSYCSLSDNTRTTPDGFNEANKVAVWSKKGKTLLVRDLSLFRSSIKLVIVCFFSTPF